MRPSLLSFIFSFFAFAALAQDEILFTVGDTPVKRSEFEYIYRKNNFNNKSDYSRQSLQDYLDLYVNFRLKVREAVSQGLDQGDRFRDELNSYEQQLLDSYLDKEVLEKTIKQEYTRSLQDVSLSHIFFQASGDTAFIAAGKKAEMVSGMISSGELTFEGALSFSEDAQTRDNSGMLGWFNSLQIAFPEIEDAAYSLQPGQVSRPIRTKLGYHIIKLNDIRPARKKLRVAIIKKFFPAENGGVSTQALEDTMRHIHDLLKAGTPFDQLVRQYSEDEFSVPNGGQLEWFGINTYAKVFEETAFSLQKPGDFSEPFKSKSAWYIIQLVDTSRFQSLEDATPILKSKLAASPQYQSAMDQFVARLKQRYNAQVFTANLPAFKARLRTLPVTYPYQYRDTSQPALIMQIGNEPVDENAFGKVVQQLFYTVNPAAGEDKFDALVRRSEQYVLIGRYKDEIRQTNAEFRALMDEYRNGIMIFDLSEKNIWNKAAEDTAGLLGYYKQFPEKFRQPKQATSRTVTLPDMKSANAVYKFLKSNLEVSDAAVADYIRSLGVDVPLVRSQVVEDGKTTVSLAAPALDKPLKTDDGYVISQVYAIKPSRIRAFEECRGYVVAAYQENIEKKWLSDLRIKYPVTVNQAVFDSMVKK